MPRPKRAAPAVPPGRSRSPPVIILPVALKNAESVEEAVVVVEPQVPAFLLANVFRVRIVGHVFILPDQWAPPDLLRDFSIEARMSHSRVWIPKKAKVPVKSMTIDR